MTCINASCAQILKFALAFDCTKIPKAFNNQSQATPDLCTKSRMITTDRAFIHQKDISCSTHSEYPYVDPNPLIHPLGAFPSHRRLSVELVPVHVSATLLSEYYIKCKRFVSCSVCVCEWAYRYNMTWKKSTACYDCGNQSRALEM